MSRKAADFKAAYQVLVESSAADAGRHLPAEELIAWHQGELAGEEEACAREHLLACRECLDAWRGLRSFLETEPGPLPEAVTDIEVARFTRRLRAGLEASGAGAAGEPRLAPPAWRPIAVAAAVTAVLGLSLWLVILHRSLAARERTIAELEAPRPGAPIHDLASGAGLRGGGELRMTEVVAGTGFMVILTPDDAARHPAHRLEIFDSGGAKIYRVEDLPRNVEDDTFTLWIPPGFLEAGDYRLELVGLADGRGETIASYGLRIVPPRISRRVR